MKWLINTLATLFLLLGVPVTVLGTSEILDAKTSEPDRGEAIAAVVILGIPPTVLGSWMLWWSRQRSRRLEQERLRAAFFRLLQENDGSVTTLRFSMETGLDGRAAKAYLDERAKEFNGLYNVTEEGNLSYRFELDGKD